MKNSRRGGGIGLMIKHKRIDVVKIVLFINVYAVEFPCPGIGSRCKIQC